MRVSSRSSTAAKWRWQPLLFIVTMMVLSSCHSEVIQLTSQEFYEMATTGQIDLMIDTRTPSEWASGHVENATFIDSLQTELSSTSDYEATLRELNLWDCRNCRVLVYCRSGVRAGQALDHLVRAGFQGPLYNGLGVSQWTEAGYSLVNDASVDDRPCMTISASVSRQMGDDDVSVCLEAQLEEDSTITVYDQHQMELDTAKELFLAQMESKNATAYSFLYTLSCFCAPADYPWNVTVALQPQMMMGMKPAPNQTLGNGAGVHHEVGDVVLSAITTTGEDVLLMENTFLNAYSILDLFDKIQEAITGEAYDIRVVYDAEWGYPSDIAIDYDEMVADEELYITTSDMTIIMLDKDDDTTSSNSTRALGIQW